MGGSLLTRPELCVALLLLTLVAPTVPGIPGSFHPHAPVSSGSRSIASPTAGSALARAVASLNRGAGPAAGAGLSCALSGGGFAHCAAPLRPHPFSPSGSDGWANVTISAKSPPYGFGGSGMAYDAKDNETVLFGGLEGPAYGLASASAVGSTYLYKSGSWSFLNTSSTTAPSARWAIMDDLTYDAKDGYVLLFGGRDGSVGLSDTWKFSGGNWTDLTPNLTASPPGRYAGSMTYDAADGYVVLYGGINTSYSSGKFADTWSYAGGKWTNRTASVAPPPLTYGALGYDAADGNVVLFGGYDVNNLAMNETWTYQAGTWTKLTLTVAPSPRSETPFVYNAANGYLMLVDGCLAFGCFSDANDTWRFFNGSWYNISSDLTLLPPLRGSHMATYDASEGYVLLFGGDIASGAKVNDTWAFNLSAVSATLHVARRALDVNQSVANGDVNQTFTFTPTGIGGSFRFSYGYQGLPAGCNPPNDTRFSCTFAQSGTFNVSVNASDLVTPTSWAVANATVVVRPDPRATLTASRPLLEAGQPLVLTAAVTGGWAPGNYTYSGLPPGCVSANTSSLHCSPSRTGNYSLRVLVRDAATVSNRSDPVALTVVRGPSVVLAASAGALDLGQGVNLTVTPSGGVAPLSVAWNGLPGGCSAANVSSVDCVPTQSGSFNVSVTVQDASGAVNSSNVVALAVYPRLAVAIVPDALAGNAPFHDSFAAQLSGGSPNVSLQWVLGDGTTANGTTVADTYTQPGRYEVRLWANDSLGERSSQNLTLIVVTRLTAVLSSLPAPANLTVGALLELNVSSANGLPPVTYAWTGLPRGCLASTASNVSCRPTASGTSRARVEVSDGIGPEAALSLNVVVNPALHLVVNVGPPPSGCGGSVTFNFTAVSSGGTPPYTLTWTFGDQSGSELGSAVSHTYSSDGTYNVTTRLVDGSGVELDRSQNVSATIDRCPAGGGGASGSWLYGIALAAVVVAAVGVVLYVRRRPAPPSPATPSHDDVPFADAGSPGESTGREPGLPPG